MAFPRLDEVKELWRTLPAKINAIGDYFEALAATLAGKVIKSITTDENGKAQLVNDLADGELLPDLVYGTDSEGARGWKPDYGGRIGETPVDTTAPTDGQVPVYDEATGKYIPGAQAVDSGLVGTREVDETAIADGRILAYVAASGKLEYVADQTGGGGAGFLVLPYLLWRTAFGSTFSGLMDAEMEIATDPTFAVTESTFDSGTDPDEFRAFSAASGTYIPWEAAGMPATDVIGIVYTEALDLSTEVRHYMRWRVYEHGTTNYGEWIPGGIL